MKLRDFVEMSFTREKVEIGYAPSVLIEHSESEPVSQRGFSVLKEYTVSATFSVKTVCNQVEYKERKIEMTKLLYHKLYGDFRESLMATMNAIDSRDPNIAREMLMEIISSIDGEGFL